MRNIITLAGLAWFLFFTPAAAQDTKVTRENRAMEEFNQLMISGDFNVILQQGDIQAVAVEGPDEAVKNVMSQVKSRSLVIFYTGTPATTKIKVIITVRDLSVMKVRGAVELTTAASLALQSLELDIMGKTNADLKMKTTSLKAMLGGGCRLTMSGEADNAEYELVDNAQLLGKNFVCQSVTISMSGTSISEVNAQGMINAKLSDAALLKYKGKANLVKTLSGEASVKKLD